MTVVSCVVLLFAVFTIGRAAVTDQDLRDLTETLLRSDTNNAAKYIQVNYQGHTSSGSNKDAAPNPLLAVNNRAYQSPTISKLRLLYNNYIPDSSMNEHVTTGERAEENQLLEAIVNTPVMDHVRRFLVQKGLVKRDHLAFKDLLKQIWFGMYSRGGGKVGSSAFEHVFLGELKKGEVSGLHNWVYFNNQEAQRHADYLGYIKKLDLGERGAILKHHFKWSNVAKPVGTMFVGTSPELEMALYTVCFMTRPNERCPVSLAGKHFNIKTHTFRYRGKSYIGSAYPEI